MSSQSIEAAAKAAAANLDPACLRALMTMKPGERKVLLQHKVKNRAFAHLAKIGVVVYSLPTYQQNFTGGQSYGTFSEIWRLTRFGEKVRVACVAKVAEAIAQRRTQQHT
jgi:hypothetical protein